MKNAVEIRTLNVEVRADADDKMQIVGTAIGYNLLSQDLGGFRERVAPGAVTRALAEKQDVRALFNHDPNRIMGRMSNGTLALIDSRTGLNFRVQLSSDISWHRDLWASVKRGDIDECSFGFTVKKPGGEDWEASSDERGNPIALRTLKDIDLQDISVVTYPAYKNATNAAARAMRSRGVSYRSFDASVIGKEAALRHRCVIATIAREGRKILLERQSAAEFRIQTKLALAKASHDMGIDIWIPEGYDTRTGLPTGLRPMTVAEFDVEVRRRAERITDELTPRDFMGRKYGDADFGMGSDPEIGF